MGNDCGCTKKLVDKIYIENNCCGKKKEQTNCGNSCCTSCGKQIDLIDSDLYAENIYNYTTDNNFGAELIILKEGELINSVENISDRDKVYNILLTTNLKTEVLIQLKRTINGIYGLKCIASLKEDNGEYKLLYIRQYLEENDIQYVNFTKTVPYKNILCIYTSDGQTVTYETIDISYFTCLELVNILQQYATQEWVENKFVEYLSNYYTKTEIDLLILNIHQGEDCLFATNTYNGTYRKGDSSKADGNNSFAIQGSEVEGRNSIGFSGSKVYGNNSLGIVKSSNIEENVNVIEDDSTSCIAMIGSTIEGISNDSIAISKSNINKANNSIALAEGTIDNSNYSISFGKNSFSGFVKQAENVPEETINVQDGNSKNSFYSISLNGGTSSGPHSLSMGSNTYSVNEGSISVGKENYNSGFYAGVFGHYLDIGRYKKLGDDNYTYFINSSLEKKGLGSYGFGLYSSIIGNGNFTAGERHFIKGNHSAAFGVGNTVGNSEDNISASLNLLFGTRCRVERGSHSLVGGLYSLILYASEVPSGAISLGDTLPVENLYLKVSTEQQGTPEFELCYYSNGSYINVTLNSMLGDLISKSTVVLRNGAKQYLGTVRFTNYLNNVTERIYPTIDTVRFVNNNIKITLKEVNLLSKLEELLDPIILEPTTKYYKCTIKFSRFSNIVDKSGNIAFGTGNIINNSSKSIAIGTGNEIIDGNEGTVTIGNFNDPRPLHLAEGENIIFSIGNGYFNKNTYTIKRRNAFEITETVENGDTPKVKDMYITIQNKRCSLGSLLDTILAIQELSTDQVAEPVRSIIDAFKAVEIDDIDSSSILSTNLVNPSSIGQNINMSDMPGWQPEGYVKISDTTVFDPNGVLPQGED